MAYTIGVDYGTQSGRVVLLDLGSGREVAVSAVPYAHGVIDDVLPSTGEKLPPDYALQHPDDYIGVLNEGIADVLRQSGIDPVEVIGLGVDFTSCTVLPVTDQGVPLCTLPAWANHRHAWPKLWKHHAAQPIADRINEVAARRGETFLSRYGGRISSEWYFPKLIEVFEQDRPVYDACARFIEATDFIIWYLTGHEMRNSCTAGYKAMWSDQEGLPDTAFFTAVNPAFTNPSEKLGDTFYPLGSSAGKIRADVARALGLGADVAVAVGNVDAMVSAPSVGVTEQGALVMVIGTSICHIAVADDEVRLPGITGVVKDGVLPGLYGYEAGQAAVGDMFEWFVGKALPGHLEEVARQEGLSVHELLEREAAKQAPGQHGLVALDWWNGNRTILGDADLTGLIVGLTLSTSPVEIYRALLESVAFGTRRIVENFVAHGVPIDSIVACGGIAQKNELLMQIYADACNLPVVVCASTEVPARGSALFGAVAAGSARGGFDTIAQASAALAAPVLKTYTPNAAAHAVYDQLYAIYRDLYEHFGRDAAELMHKLKGIRLDALG